MTVINSANNGVNTVQTNTSGTRIADNSLEATTPQEKKLKSACQGFEELLIEQMFNSMRETIPQDDSVEEDPGKSIYDDMLYSNIAQNFAQQGGFGLWQTLYKQEVSRMDAEKSDSAVSGAGSSTASDSTPSTGTDVAPAIVDMSGDTSVDIGGDTGDDTTSE